MGVVVVDIGVFSAVEPDPLLHQAADPVNPCGNGILRGLGAVKGDSLPHPVGQLRHQGAYHTGQIPLHAADVQRLHREGYQKLQKPIHQQALKLPAFDLCAGGVHHNGGKIRIQFHIKGVGAEGLRIRVEIFLPEPLRFRGQGECRPPQQDLLGGFLRPQPVTGQQIAAHLCRLPVQPFT